MASIWNKLFTGDAGDGVPPVTSVGLMSSEWITPTLLVLNSAVLPNPLTKLAASITATVPVASEVDAMISKSNFGPAVSLSLTA